mmetsp:Transcript_53911/g.136663  ORF Transcript_53911/g.136663 Transcript_53911/m.136663 type:complete len:215 (-) Transcript_53911:443-1087(-)
MDRGRVSPECSRLGRTLGLGCRGGRCRGHRRRIGRHGRNDYALGPGRQRRHDREAGLLGWEFWQGVVRHQCRVGDVRGVLGQRHNEERRLACETCLDRQAFSRFGASCRLASESHQRRSFHAVPARRSHGEAHPAAVECLRRRRDHLCGRAGLEGHGVGPPSPVPLAHKLQVDWIAAGRRRLAGHADGQRHRGGGGGSVDDHRLGRLRARRQGG